MGAAAAAAPRAAAVFLPLALAAAIGSFVDRYDLGRDRARVPHITVVYPSRPAIDADFDGRIWAACRAMQTFLLDFDEVLTWPDGTLYLVVLRVGEGHDQLEALNHAAERREELVVPHPEPYVPHLTLAAGLPGSLAAEAAREADRFLRAVPFEARHVTCGRVDELGDFHAEALMSIGHGPREAA